MGNGSIEKTAYLEYVVEMMYLEIVENTKPLWFEERGSEYR